MKKSLLNIILFFCSVIAFGQSAIKLKTDTSDKYVICFKNNGYTLYFGYKTFFNYNQGDAFYMSNKEILKLYIDSSRIRQDTCILNDDFFDQMGYRFKIKLGVDTLSQYDAEEMAYAIATYYVNRGEVKIYSDSEKIFLNEIYTKRKRERELLTGWWEWYGIKKLFFEKGHKIQIWQKRMKTFYETWSVPSF